MYLLTCLHFLVFLPERVILRVVFLELRKRQRDRSGRQPPAPSPGPWRHVESVWTRHLSSLWGASSSVLNGLFSHRFRNSRKFNVTLSLRPRRPRRRWNSSSFRLKSRRCSSRWRSCMVMMPSLSVSILKKAAYGSWSQDTVSQPAPETWGRPHPRPALRTQPLREGWPRSPVAFFGFPCSGSTLARSCFPRAMMNCPQARSFNAVQERDRSGFSSPLPCSFGFCQWYFPDRK